jgi:cell volume regulation protein A
MRSTALESPQANRGARVEPAGAVEVRKQVLTVFGVVLGIGTLSGILAKKAKVPDVAVFLLVGMLLGPAASGLVNVRADSALNQLILIFGSCYILFDGGASLRLKVLKEVWITIVVISTVGVAITAVITGYVAYLVLGVPLIVAMLLGATLASTDPATLVPIFKQVHVKDRVAQTVMSESAFNDAMGAIATFTVLGIAMGSGEFSLGAAAFKLVKESILGIVAGGVLGYLAALLIAHEKWNFLAEYAPVVTLMAVIGAYMTADGLAASGFMAVFVFGIVIGNKDSLGFTMEAGEQRRLEEFVLTTAFVMRMFIFILLGSQVDFGLMYKYLAGGVLGGHRVHAGGAARHRVPLRRAGPAREVERQGNAVHVLDPGNRRDPGRARRPAGRHEGAGCRHDRLGDLHRGAR